MSEQTAYRERREALRANRTVKRPIARIDSDISKKNKGGGSKRRMSPKQMTNKINRYFEYCEEEDQVPSIKGMMIHMKMYRNAFYKYMQVPEYTDLLEHARMIISEWAESDVYNTSGQAAGKIAYMKNLHGWSDKLETKNESEVRHVTSVEEARQKLEALAPQLLELLKSSTAVNQIAKKSTIYAEFVEVEDAGSEDY